jgi:hypothetical protein
VLDVLACDQPLDTKVLGLPVALHLLQVRVRMRASVRGQGQDQGDG